MIFEWLLGTFMGFVAYVFTLLPSFNAPLTGTWLQWFDRGGEQLSAISQWVNIGLMLTLLGIAGSSLALFAVVKAITWVLSKVPFLGVDDS